MPARNGSGQKIIPIAIKEVKGTRRPVRERDVPPPSEKLPNPPSTLNKRAKQIFQHLVKNRLTDIGLASATHTEAIALLAREMEQLERLDSFLNENGFTYTKITGEDKDGNKTYSVKKWPQVDIQRDLSRHVHSLIVEFGLTPASSQKIGPIKKKEKKSDKDNYFK